MNPHRLITTLYAGLMVVLALAAGAWFMDARAEFRRLKQVEAEREQLLANARSRLAEQEKILKRLREDPAFVEKVLRQRLVYGRPGEIVFRYED